MLLPGYGYAHLNETALLPGDGYISYPLKVSGTGAATSAAMTAAGTGTVSLPPTTGSAVSLLPEVGYFQQTLGGSFQLVPDGGYALDVATPPPVEGQGSALLPVMSATGSGHVNDLGSQPAGLRVALVPGDGYSVETAEDGLRLLPGYGFLQVIVDPGTRNSGNGAASLPATTGAGAGRVGPFALASVTRLLPGFDYFTETQDGDVLLLPGGEYIADFHNTDQLPVDGSGATTAPAAGGVGFGTQILRTIGSAPEVTMPMLTATGVGSVIIRGGGSASLPVPTASGFVSQVLNTIAVGVGELPRMVCVGTGTVSGVEEPPEVVRNAVPVVLTLPAMGGQGAGTLPISGMGAATMPAMTAHGSGQQGVRGSGSATMPAMTAFGSDALFGFSSKGRVGSPSGADRTRRIGSSVARDTRRKIG